ncbi:hypothetical protein K491DRAFT_49796 [Lophiostoma macrostomum CBS 122681]|uniref:Secreted protein n=1 Tax=Lophiostoma macrostomum CBS 122681 TaxID=1314788 RepID=A0A6A6SXW8_9PLEO|nr:hypothetical protein K491DRAFT_49796 [Lophiostoma macrostomum CBS 122681]
MISFLICATYQPMAMIALCFLGAGSGLPEHSLTVQNQHSTPCFHHSPGFHQLAHYPTKPYHPSTWSALVSNSHGWQPLGKKPPSPQALSPWCCSLSTPSCHWLELASDAGHTRSHVSNAMPLATFSDAPEWRMCLCATVYMGRWF